MTEKTEREINEKLAREKFRLRSIAEAVEQSKAIITRLLETLLKNSYFRRGMNIDAPSMRRNISLL